MDLACTSLTVPGGGATGMTTLFQRCRPQQGYDDYTPSELSVGMRQPGEHARAGRRPREPDLNRASLG